MSDFTDYSWDIQFQLDHADGRVNIGWFWARPSMQTIDYFKRSKQKWQSSGGWDQAVMNKILTALENSQKANKSLQIPSIRRLDTRKFLNFMNTYWYRALSPRIGMQTNFYNLDDDTRYKMIQNASEEAVMWHYTCIEKPLKIFLAKYFGQWTNLDEYYTRQRKFLSPINLGYGSNNSKVLLIEFLLAVKIALISKRTLIFPDVVSYHPFAKFPGVRTFSIREIQLLGIEHVEPTFLYHRKFRHHIDVSDEFTFHFSTLNNETVTHVLTRLIEELGSSLKWEELIILDFSQFKAFNELMKIQNFDEWWKSHMTINVKLHTNISKIRLCGNINAKSASCLRICT